MKSQLSNTSKKGSSSAIKVYEGEVREEDKEVEMFRSGASRNGRGGLTASHSSHNSVPLRNPPDLRDKVLEAAAQRRSGYHDVHASRQEQHVNDFRLSSQEDRSDLRSKHSQSKQELHERKTLTQPQMHSRR